MFLTGELPLTIYLDTELWQQNLKGALALFSSVILVWNTPVGFWSIVMGLAFCGAMLNLLPRIRIDQNGIRFRTRFWWTTWTWDEFASGRIGYAPRVFGYQHSEWPRTILRLDQISPRDAATVVEFVHGAGLPRRFQSSLGDIVIRLRGVDWRSVTLRADGMSIRGLAGESDYRWCDVSLTILRLAAGRPDFHELKIVVTDQALLLTRGSLFDNWRGCSAEDLVALFYRHVESSHIDDFALHGPVWNSRELDARFHYKNRGQNVHTIRAQGMMFFVSGMMMATLCGQAPAAMFVFFLTLYGSYIVVREPLKRIERKQGDYESQRAQLLEMEAESQQA